MRHAEGGPDPAVARPGGSRMLGALRHRNYRLFLTGQIISTVGTWMQSVAMPWLALQLTHSGLLVGAVGVPVCFLANSVSYLAAVAALLLMRNLPAVVREQHDQRWRRRLAEGASYVVREPVVGLLLIDVAVFSLFAMNRLTLIPLFADQVLHAGASGFGFLMASMGLGALVGALTLAFFPGLGADPARQFWLGLLWVAALLVFSFSRVFLLSTAALFVAGYSQISFVATANSRIQTLTPDGLRGRVMGLYAQALIGVGPLGAMQAGALATFLGAPWAMAIGASIAGAVVVATRL